MSSCWEEFVTPLFRWPPDRALSFMEVVYCNDIAVVQSPGSFLGWADWMSGRKCWICLKMVKCWSVFLQNSSRHLCISWNGVWWHKIGVQIVMYPILLTADSLYENCLWLQVYLVLLTGGGNILHEVSSPFLSTLFSPSKWVLTLLLYSKSNGMLCRILGLRVKVALGLLLV